MARDEFLAGQLVMMGAIVQSQFLKAANQLKFTMNGMTPVF